MVLYKYLTPERVDVLERGRIRFTPPGEFNDPLEFRPYIESALNQSHLKSYVEENFEEILRKNLAEYPLSSQIPMARMIEMFRPFKAQVPQLFNLLQPQLLSQVSKAIQDQFNSNVGVLCLSEVRDSLLMWGHYTDNHQGFVIGFDASNPFFKRRRGLDDEFGFLRKVTYQASRPRVTMAATTSAEWFETKSEAWAYEREWRMLRVLDDAETRLESAPHPIFLFEFAKEAIT